MSFVSVVAEIRASFVPDRAMPPVRHRGIGAVSAVAAVVVSSWSHLRGGGSSGGIVDLAPLLVAAGLLGASLGHRRWSFAALLSALVVLQPAVHLTMSRHGSAMGGPASMMDGRAASPWTMVALHAAGVVITAVTLRYGGRWLSTMPVLLTAALGLRRRAVTWPMPHLAMLVIQDRCVPQERVGVTNWSRGPPR